MKRTFAPQHPGRVLKDALDQIPMTVTAFAAHLGVNRVTLSRITNGNASITAAMSIRIAEAFGHAPDRWFKQQADYDFWMAMQEKRKRVRALKLVA